MSEPRARIEIAGHQILGPIVHSLRRKVFVEVEGFGLDMVEAEVDQQSTHVVFWEDDKPLGCISLVPPSESWMSSLQFDIPTPPVERCTLVTKLVVLPGERGSQIARLFVGCVDQIAAESWDCRYAISVLMGPHAQLKRYYRRLACFKEVAGSTGRYGPEVVVMADCESPEFEVLRADHLTPARERFIETGGHIVFRTQ